MEATQLLRAVQQGLDLQQQLMEGIRQQRVQMQQQEQAQAQMQQLQQAWCTFNSNSRNQQLKMRGFAHPHCDRFAPYPFGWRFGVPRPFRFEFPTVTHARAGNVQIHRRPCFLDARSNLESVITLRSKGYRDLLVFDVIEVCLFSMGVSFFFARTLDC